jgi:hypothetical protein
MADSEIDARWHRERDDAIEACAHTNDDKLIDRIAAMLWTFDGAPEVRKAAAEREREAYRARAGVLLRIFNEGSPALACAELAVQECLPLLPLEGAWPDYGLATVVHAEVRALPEEWASAAQAIADLGRALPNETGAQSP